MKKFEERLAKLEEISEQMRTDSLPLDKAMKLFEEGTALARELDKEITKAERKVEQLISQPTEEDMTDEKTGKESSPTESIEEEEIILDLFSD